MPTHDPGYALLRETTRSVGARGPRAERRPPTENGTISAAVEAFLTEADAKTAGHCTVMNERRPQVLSAALGGASDGSNLLPLWAPA